MRSQLSFAGVRARVKAALPLVGLFGFLFLFRCSGGKLPFDEHIGLQGLSSFTLGMLRFLAVIWAGLLFYTGSRWPRFAVGSLFLPLSLMLSYRMLGEVNYLLTLLASWAIFATLMALYLRWPRLTGGFAAAWILPAIYVSYLFYSGSFFFNRILIVGLLVIGGLFAVTRPRLGLTALASALATYILLFALPFSWSLGWIIGVFLAGLLLQQLILPRLQGWEPAEDRTEDGFLSCWKGSVAGAAVISIALLLAVLVTIPQIDLRQSPFPARVERLGLASPTLIFSAEDNYYLSQTPHSMALAAPESGFLERITVMFTGRDYRKAIHRLRTIKDSTELAKMRRAAEITLLAFEKIAPLVRPGVTEAELARVIAETFEQNGASGLAFPSIVGAGENATLPHYSANSGTLDNGFLVVDIGCMFENYASDMTRTFPVTREYSEAQQRLLKIVLATADSCVKRLKPGHSFRELNRLSHKLIEAEGFGKYYLHGLGHPVGLNVHDPSVDTLRTGMVVTIEPGIYVPENAEVDSIYWNLGVRVEDSYIITADSCEQITNFPHIPFEGSDRTPPQ